MGDQQVLLDLTGLENADQMVILNSENIQRVRFIGNLNGNVVIGEYKIVPHMDDMQIGNTIVSLSKSGFSVSPIAKVLNMTEDEVIVILNKRSNQATKD